MATEPCQRAIAGTAGRCIHRRGRPRVPLPGAGLARREPDLADRRRNVITISKRGSVALERLDGILDDVQDAVLAPLTRPPRGPLIDVGPVRDSPAWM